MKSAINQIFLEMNRNIAENDDYDEFSEEIIDEPHSDIVMDAIGKRRVIFKTTVVVNNDSCWMNFEQIVILGSTLLQHDGHLLQYV